MTTQMFALRRRRRRPSRGQTIVELALILPVMLLLLATASDLGRIFHSRIVIANAARAGALEAARRPTSYVPGAACSTLTNRIMCAVVAESTGSLLNVTPADVGVVCDPSPCSEALGNVVRVTVDGDFNLITPFLGNFFGGQTIALSSTATAQIAVQPVISAPNAIPTPSPTPSPTPTPTPAPTATPGPTSTPAPTPTPSPTPSPTPVCFPPTADFSVSPSTGKKKKTDFAFTDLSTTTALCPLTWSWNFGDGAGDSTSTLMNPIHQYQAQGTFTITLVVSNAGGPASRSRTVTVTP
ncbi:MAG: PKD domain-containing protein [Candidatus Limnocylindrales bacterium]